MAPPLHTLRVLDLSTGIAGPYCTKLMADYGARVIKAESPHSGDPGRRQRPFPGDVPHPEKSGLFLFLNTGKEGITLDLESATGQRLLRRLLREVDVVVQSFPPAKAEALGLRYQQLARENPRLVVTTLPEFGVEGPRRDDKMTDLIAFAITGFMYPMGEPDRPPVQPGGPFSGFITGLYGCYASLMAYLAALPQGQGQQVEVSRLEAVNAAVIYDVTRWSYSGIPRRRLGRAYGYNQGIRLSIQPTQDGYIGFIVGPGYERWRVLWETLLETPEVLEDERFQTPQQQLAQAPALEEKAQVWLRQHTSEEIFHTAQGLRLLFAQILSMQDLFHNEHLRARGYFQPVTHPALGTVELPGLPLRFSETPAEGLRPAPMLGQHNRKVYGELLGLAPADLVHLRACGVI
ncbi:MAG: CoA transferase [Chloroflexi bacterium]|nr:CoA transferase [Chloroflexota bacterium]